MNSFGEVISTLFGKKKYQRVPTSSTSYPWPEDEKKVRDGTFLCKVLYLGSKEVEEEDGDEVYNQAVRALKADKSGVEAVIDVSRVAMRVVVEGVTIPSHNVLSVNSECDSGDCFAFISSAGVGGKKLCHVFLCSKKSQDIETDFNWRLYQAVAWVCDWNCQAELQRGGSRWELYDMTNERGKCFIKSFSSFLVYILWDNF